MKFLKHGGKIGIFFVIHVTVFLLSYHSALAVLTDDECIAKGGICMPTVASSCPDGYKSTGPLDACSPAPKHCCKKEDPKPPTSEELDVACINKCGQCRPQLGNETKPECESGWVPSGDACGIRDGVDNGCCIKTDQKCEKPGTNASSSGTASLNYTPLENLPGFEGQSGDFASYFKSLYSLALWIVGISALFMLVVGGFLYLSSAGNTSLLGTAKKTIYGALIGIVIALVSWLLLNTINSDLTNLKLSGLSGAVGDSNANNASDGKPSTATGKTDKSGCEALNNVVVKSHCNLASDEIVKILSCMESKGVKKGKEVNGYAQYSAYSLTSNGVGGDQAASAACCGHTTAPGGKCPHSDTTCHHGCSYGTKGLSYAADVWTEGLSESEICNLASIAHGCGSGNIWGPFTKCGVTKQDGHSNHLHVSTSGCNH